MRCLVCLLSLLAAFALFASSLDPVAAGSGYKVYLPLVTKPSAASFGYGLNVARPENSSRVSEMGFGYVKYQIKWKDGEPRKGHYDWTDADLNPHDSFAGNYVRDTAAGLKIVLRVDSPPGWANGNRGDCAPPDNPADYGDFMHALSSFLRSKYPGRVVAYEIWNEPNLPGEWCGRAPSPAEYTALLREAYRGVKAGDPQAKVVTAGMATTGGGGGAISDLDFIRGMYQAGAKPYFDVLGSHPYGFASSPETEPWGDRTLFFRRVEQQRQIMLDHGDGAKQVWATEFNWLIDPAAYGSGCSWPDRDWQKVSPQTQADYLVRAYQYAYKNWPWMGVMLSFNLDFAATPWYGECDSVRWYAITSGDLTPRPAYTALKNMAKPAAR